MDYEVYKYIDQHTEDNISFEEILENNNLTYDEADGNKLQFVKNFRELLSKYGICSRNIVGICNGIIEKINENSDNQELQYLYFCVITDNGIINKINYSENDDERILENYIQQQKKINSLNEFMELQRRNLKKLNDIRSYLKSPVIVSHTEYEEEFEIVFNMTLQHTFLYGNRKNQIYKDNLHSVLDYLNGNEVLKTVKPYVLFAVLARKHGMIQKRKNFIPNIKSLFKYQSYNIIRDNGKNFNNYQSYTELYEQFRRSYMEDEYIDIELCDFCFANLSLLCEWYYMWCRPD